MATITREQFLQPVKRPMEKVDLPEFGEGQHIFVSGMTAKERNEFDKQFQTGKRGADLSEVREKLVVAAACDENGNRLFTWEDVQALGTQSAHVVERIVNAAQRVCGMSNDDVEDLAGN